MSVRVESAAGVTPEAAGAGEVHKQYTTPLAVRILGGVAAWALIVLAFQQGLQRGIGFSGEEAFVLAGSLGIMAGTLVVLLLGVNVMMNAED